MKPSLKIAFVGTAGWSVPRSVAGEFPDDGTHLERYARVLPCAEINSSFYRMPKLGTWAKWAAAVPESFRFAVKAPKTLTHGGLVVRREEIAAFLEGATQLGDRLGPLLFQFPPKQIFDAKLVGVLLNNLRQDFTGAVAVEPRHASWFTDGATALLREFDIARVATDPARVPEAAVPLPSRLLTYYRWHGSPRIYYSAYTVEQVENLHAEVARFAEVSDEVWVIFDNTAMGAAAANALELMRTPML